MIRTIALSFAVALCAASTAQAGTFARPPQQVSVAYADLNLTAAADIQTLGRRIHDAALAVCGPVNYPAGMGFSLFLKAREDNARCVARAESGARQRLAALQGSPTRMAASGN